MADYRCPNCAGYRNCKPDCPTGGVVARERYRLYRAVGSELAAYWVDQRAKGFPHSLDGVRRAIDKAFGFGEEN